MSWKIDDDTRFRVMRAIENDPRKSQRDIARQLGISLGLVNHCIRALVGKGQVKIRNFRASDRKLRYAYVLTPRGLSDKAKLTRDFLARRVAEYEALRSEIEELSHDLPEFFDLEQDQPANSGKDGS